MPGTLFTYIPKWMFFLAGALLQLPLPIAYYYLRP